MGDACAEAIWSTQLRVGREFETQGAFMIEHYQEGSYLKIDGTRYYDDLKIIDGRVKERWWRSQGHRLQTEDIFDILAAKPETFVIGTGYAGNLRVPDDVRSAIENKDIGVVAAKTAQAIEIFNRLHAEGKDVAGAFHLTC
jgi:hypothetical protein